jgi:DNA-binding CsgD family transcriptional regulator
MSHKPLTVKQAEVIRLVSRGYETKEIARQLGISPTTVDQRIEGARKKLGGGTRKEAARRYLAQQDISERHIYVPPRLADDQQSGPTSGPPQNDLQFQDALFDDRAHWDRGSVWRLPSITPGDLVKAGRLILVFLLALVMMLGAGEAIDLFQGIGGRFPR